MSISHLYVQKLIKTKSFIHGYKQKTYINEILYFLTIWLLSLVWMHYSRSLNNKINRIQETTIQASKNFFKRINLSPSTGKTYSTLPYKSSKVKWEFLQTLSVKLFDLVKIQSIVLGVVYNLRNLVLVLFNSAENLQII